MYGAMNLAIWKYTLEVTDEQVLQIPYPAKILSAKEQNNQIVLYALVSPDSREILGRVVKVVGTGHPCQGIGDYRFLDTVKLMDGKLMFHVFVGCEA